jgi:hypothetical protein
MKESLELRSILDFLRDAHKIKNVDAADALGLDSQKMSNVLRSTNRKTIVKHIEKLKDIYSKELSDYE